MMQTMFLLLAYVLATALAACTSAPRQVPQEIAAPMPSGAYSSAEVLLANGTFRPYRDERVSCLFDLDLHVSLRIPGKGEVQVLLDPVPARYGSVRSWEKDIDGTNLLKVDQDVHGRIYLTYGDRGEDGTSNAIGWRFDPWARNG